MSVSFQLFVFVGSVEPYETPFHKGKDSFYSSVFWVVVCNIVFCDVVEKHRPYYYCSSYSDYCSYLVSYQFWFSYIFCRISTHFLPKTVEAAMVISVIHFTNCELITLGYSPHSIFSPSLLCKTSSLLIGPKKIELAGACLNRHNIVEWKVIPVVEDFSVKCAEIMWVKRNWFHAAPPTCCFC